MIDRVLCALVPKVTEVCEEDLWMDLEDYSLKTKTFYYDIIPLIDHPHSDKENGQKEIHYHADYRYNGEQPALGKYKINIDSTRPIKGEHKTKYFDLIRHTEDFLNITPSDLIKNSKLKHKCIHKGKCPHRGFDLTGVQPKNGVITCPLHGLKFDAKNKKLIKL